MNEQENEKIPGWVGSTAERACALIILGLFIYVLDIRYSGEGKPAVPTLLTVFLGVLSFAAIVFSSKKFYAYWMRFGKFTNKIVSTLIFSAVYLLVVPFFYLGTLIAKKFALATAQRKTFWIEKGAKVMDLEFFKRMG